MARRRPRVHDYSPGRGRHAPRCSAGLMPGKSELDRGCPRHPSSRKARRRQREPRRARHRSRPLRQERLVPIENQSPRTSPRRGNRGNEGDGALRDEHPGGARRSRAHGRRRGDGRFRARADIAGVPLGARHEQRHRLAGHHHVRHRRPEEAIPPRPGLRKDHRVVRADRTGSRIGRGPPLVGPASPERLRHQRTNVPSPAHRRACSPSARRRVHRGRRGKSAFLVPGGCRHRDRKPDRRWASTDVRHDLRRKGGRKRAARRRRPGFRAAVQVLDQPPSHLAVCVALPERLARW